MAKLRDITVNIVPKLDVRKANEMSKKLGNIMGKATNMFKNGSSFVGKAGIALNQGLDLFKKIEEIINRPRGEVSSLMIFADQIDDTAVSLGTTSARLDQLITTLSTGGANGFQTLELLKKYAARAEELGLKGEIDRMFLYELEQMGKMTAEDRLKRIKEVFGARSVVDAQDAVEAMKLWYQNRTSGKESLAQGAAYERLARSQGELDNIELQGMRQGVMIAAQMGLDKTNNELKRQDNRERNKVLSSTSPEAMLKAGELMSELKIAISASTNKLIEIISNIDEKLNVVNGIKDSIQKFTDIVSNFKLPEIPKIEFPWGKGKGK